MDVFVVQGGTRLSGSVAVSGSKNASLPIMAATLLTRGQSTLANVPDLVDVRTLTSLLVNLGCHANRSRTGELSIEVIDQTHSWADYELVRRMRASVCVMGPLLARRGFARVSLPGGCNIGHRPIDIHLRGFAALGADVQFERGDIVLTANRLKGATVDLSGPCGASVTGTSNVLSAAVLAHGRTVLTSAAQEPEVVELAEFLIRCGARIQGHGTSTIEIDGVEELHAAKWTVSADRIEAATFAIAAAITRSAIEVENAPTHQLTSVLETLQQIGVRYLQTGTSLHINGTALLKRTEVVAAPYPSVPTDVQAQLTALLATIEGRSRVTDQVFPDRFMHCAELNRMGACIRQSGNTAEVLGVSRLQGVNVMASDLRASAALVLAGLAAENETIVHRIYHLDRGYESLEEKLSQLGARIVRCREEEVRHNRPPIHRRHSA